MLVDLSIYSILLTTCNNIHKRSKHLLDTQGGIGLPGNYYLLNQFFMVLKGIYNFKTHS